LIRRAGWLAALLLAVLFAAAALAQTGVTRIEITARPIETFDAAASGQRQFGALEFRGGLELSSAEKRFGGLSAIRVGANGEDFLAVTDKGNWLRGRLTYRGKALSGITNAEMAPILAADGKPMTERGWYDSEGLADDGVTAYVSLERVHRILGFDLGRDGLQARGRTIALPPVVSKLKSNRGIECLTFAPRDGPLSGALIAISERGLDADGNIRGFLIGGKISADIFIKRKDDFDVVDCATTPEGGFLILERFFSWRQGIAVRIRRIPQSKIVPGAMLDGPTLIEADLGYQIDNMEGLSVHRAADGDIVLTLVSDDNFTMFQRTILLQFTLLER
jgi:hypothetical protein